MTPRSRASTVKLGVAALLLYLPHAAWHLLHGSAWDLLWACDVAMPVLALGCFTRQPRAVVTAFLFLLFGSPLWLLDALAGGRIVITSPLIHFGGPIVAYLALRELGWPSRSWAVASASALFVLGLSRLVSPSASNVNMAFRIYQGWERYFPSHALYLVLIWISSTTLFWLVERGATWRHLTVRSK